MAALGRCPKRHELWWLHGYSLLALGRVLEGPNPKSFGGCREFTSQPESICKTTSPNVVATSALCASQALRAGSILNNTPCFPPVFPMQLSQPLAYEIIQGALVRGCTMNSTYSHPPTIVLVHGILGSRRNLQSYAKMLVEGFPSWQAVLVDLRCHGDSASLFQSSSPHTVESAATDVLSLLSNLKLFPHILIGHSFGGKVVMSMAQQFGERLPRPVQVWVLDALPGDVRAGEHNRRDHPLDLISTLKMVPQPIRSRNTVVGNLVRAGFSRQLATWMTTNLRATGGISRGELQWSFDLHGVEELYRSYEDTNLWPLLVDAPQGLNLDFVRAAGSHYKWAGRDQDMIESYGHGVHLLKNSGHWVHADNPNGLFDIMKGSIGSADLRMRRGPFSR